MNTTLCQTVAVVVAVSLGTGFLHAAEIHVTKKGSRENNPWVFDVVHAFGNIPVKARENFCAWVDDAIVPPSKGRAQRQRWHKKRSFVQGSLQLQSIKRLPGHLGLGSYAAITGNDAMVPEPELFIVAMDSQREELTWKKNIRKKCAPHCDRVITKLKIMPGTWRAGATDMCGIYLAAPVTRDNASAVVVCDLSDPLNPRDIGITVDRPECNARAAALTKLANGTFVLAVWTDGTGGIRERGLDFYFSHPDNLSGGLGAQRMIHVPAHEFEGGDGHADYRGMSFVNDFSGALYLVCTENTGSRTPYGLGIDRIDLLKVDVLPVSKDVVQTASIYEPRGLIASLAPGNFVPFVTCVTSKHVHCKGGVSTFSVGASAYVPDQQRLLLYALPPQTNEAGDQVAFAQYASDKRTYL